MSIDTVSKSSAGQRRKGAGGRSKGRKGQQWRKGAGAGAGAAEEELSDGLVLAAMMELGKLDSKGEALVGTEGTEVRSPMPVPAKRSRTERKGGEWRALWVHWTSGQHHCSIVM